MDLYNNLTYIWNFYLGKKTRAKYIPGDIVDPCNINSTQKHSAKKAIVWLLTKTPHSVEEIADHFEMSPPLVNHLIKELVDSKYVRRENNRSSRYKLNDKKDGFAIMKSVEKVGEVS